MSEEEVLAVEPSVEAVEAAPAEEVAAAPAEEVAAEPVAEEAVVEEVVA